MKFDSIEGAHTHTHESEPLKSIVRADIFIVSNETHAESTQQQQTL